jgi:hypothetical protein
MRFCFRSSQPHEIDQEQENLKTMQISDRIESLNDLTVRESESRSSAKIGRFPAGTVAIVRAFGEDPCRVQCEFLIRESILASCRESILGWISLFDKKLGKPLVKRIEQGQPSTETRPGRCQRVSFPEHDDAEEQTHTTLGAMTSQSVHEAREQIPSTEHGSSDASTATADVMEDDAGSDASTGTADVMEDDAGGWDSEEEV